MRDPKTTVRFPYDCDYTRIQSCISHNIDVIIGKQLSKIPNVLQNINISTIVLNILYL